MGMRRKLIASIDPFGGCGGLSVACGSSGGYLLACGSGNSVLISFFGVVFVNVNMELLKLEFPVEVTALVAGEGLKRACFHFCHMQEVVSSASPAILDSNVLTSWRDLRCGFMLKQQPAKILLQ